MYKVSEVLSKALLEGFGGFSVWCRIQTCCGDLGGEPIRFGEVQDQRDKVLLDLALGQLLADLVEGFNGLNPSSQHNGPDQMR